jgi:4-amino-4-deoxy-L-arabinose transferase-like glycosyltransferase
LNKTRLLFLLLFALLLAARMCHVGILWAEETLPLAAAQQMRAGHVLYRDIWFDKPPLAPMLYTALGGEAEWRLRLAGALYALLCCWIAWGFARDLWGRREGLWAAGLLGFFLIFDFPSSAIPLAADLLMLAPHLAAVWMAYRRRPLWAGALAGVAFTANPKGVLVLAVCAWWAPSWALLAGFAGVTGAVSVWMWSAGALAGYWDEVWRWGRVYAGTTFVDAPLKNGLLRTLGWAGFHAAVVIAAVGQASWPVTAERRRWLVWLAISLLGVVAGLRFFPRYYFQILPVVVLLAARGFAEMRGRRRLLALLLLIPLARFAPTYFMAARDAGWRDTAMDRDSRAAAAMVHALAKPGNTLFVWGFRPEVYVYSHLPAATRFLDSQPLTGVPADRHLTQSAPVETAESRVRRAELASSRPTFVVDGLGEYNRRLAVTEFGDLREWIAGYREVGRSAGSVIYRRE